MQYPSSVHLLFPDMISLHPSASLHAPPMSCTCTCTGPIVSVRVRDVVLSHIQELFLVISEDSCKVLCRVFDTTRWLFYSTPPPQRLSTHPKHGALNHSAKLCDMQQKDQDRCGGDDDDDWIFSHRGWFWRRLDLRVWFT